MLSESIINKRSPLVMSAKVLLVKEILPLLSTSLPLSSAKLFSSAETTSTLFPLPLKINTPLMVSFPEPYQWVSPVPESMEMMPSPVGKPPEKPANSS